MHHRLTIGDIDIGNAVFLKEIEDVVGRVECDLASESIGQDPHPNGGRSGDYFFVVTITNLVVVLFLLNPTETNEIYRRKLDISLVEEVKNLGTNVSP